jgi:AcrR family transcriptional regulator
MVADVLERKEQILNEARTLFARLGFRKCTTDDIAKACGLTKAAIYHYYENKEIIFVEVIKRETSLLMSDISKAVQACVRPSDRLIAYMLTRFDRIRQMANLNEISRAMGNEAGLVAGKCRDAFFKQETELLKSIIEEGQLKGEFRNIPATVVAGTLIAAFKGIEAFIPASAGSETMQEGLRELLDIFCRGLLIKKEA